MAIPQEMKEIAYLKSYVRFWSGNFRQPITIQPRVSKSSELSVTYEFHVAIPHTAILVDSRAIFTEHSDQMNLMTVKTSSGTKYLIFTSDHPTNTIQP